MVKDDWGEMAQLDASVYLEGDCSYYCKFVFRIDELLIKVLASMVSLIARSSTLCMLYGENAVLIGCYNNL